MQRVLCGLRSDSVPSLRRFPRPVNRAIGVLAEWLWAPKLAYFSTPMEV